MSNSNKAEAPSTNGDARNHGNGAGSSSKQSNRANDSRQPQNGKATDSRTKVVRIGLEVHVTTPEKLGALAAIREATPGSTSATQEQRLLTALERFSLSTFEGTRYLDAYDVRARVMGLRNKGHNIVTTWAMVTTECGRLHRVGVYTLQRGTTVAPILNQVDLFGGAAVAALDSEGVPA